MKRVTSIALAASAAFTLAACSTAASSNDSSPTPTTVASDFEFEHPDAPETLLYTAPDVMTGETFDGTSIIGKDVILWFWASWCTVCQAEAGALVNASADFPEGVEVIGIASRADLASSQEFVESHDVAGFQHIFDEDGSIWDRFGVTGQPTLIFVNDDGVVTRNVTGGIGKHDIVNEAQKLGEM
jgi:thiol-disulfide isomerase/thioredoxin